MKKKGLFTGAIFAIVAMTVTILHNRTATAEPKSEAQPVEVSLLGIMTLSDRKQALLRVEPPAGASSRGKKYILSEGQSAEGLTVESIDVTNVTVTLRVGQIRKTLRPERSSE